MVREETDTNSSNYQTRSCMARRMDQNWRSHSESTRTGNGKTRSPNSMMLDDREELTLLILMTKITKKLSKCERKLERPMAAAMPRKSKARTSTTKVAAKEEIATPKKSPNDLWL